MAARQMARLEACREAVRAATLADEAALATACVRIADLSAQARAAVTAHAVELVRRTRAAPRRHVLESFLLEYDLSTREGVALMCLAEALLRVPDPGTIDALIEDKIAPSNWGVHLGRSSSPLVNASTWALLVTGKVLDESEDSLAGALHAAVRRLGEPVIRTAVAEVMRELGQHFVLGPDLPRALERARGYEARGYTFSYDMLGEAARTELDARRYHLAYADAITRLGEQGIDAAVAERPGISVKLSALHPRYEPTQRERVLEELVPRLAALASLARSAGIGLNVDAEEAERLDLSLEVIQAVVADPALADWDGFGVVVQAYGRRALAILDWLHALADALDRRLMVRLVKGAYWDTEVKRAQVLGLAGYPVFTRKAHTDAAYLACVRQLLGASERLYPQFATHNAHTIAAVLAMAQGRYDVFELQRLHGMGEALHEAVRAQAGTRSRIYAPVGAHEDLLAYLVRRLLENGANSSFVNQIVDAAVSPERVARDPMALVLAGHGAPNPAIVPPAALFGAQRRNSRGLDLGDPHAVRALDEARARFRAATWEAAPDGALEGACAMRAVHDPARPGEVVGRVAEATAADVERALQRARIGAARWTALPSERRAACLREFADRLEANAPELLALLAREAGRCVIDGVDEVREAADFARYYALEALRGSARGRGAIACISPWNFPLAIFSGQVLGALAAGNAVLAKPAEQTPLVAARAVALMHAAGVPPETVQLLPGAGETVGAALARDPRVHGICFTGSLAAARQVERAMAEHLSPDAPLIAETGGVNAMLVDSSALPEQAVRDIVTSAFRSAGQRCSALRILYLQEDVAERVLRMLTGAMRELRVGDPWALATDVGPLIDDEARVGIEAYCRRLEAGGQLLARLDAPKGGRFVGPALFRVSGIEAIEGEVFGPVLHVATYRAQELDRVLEAVNAAGYGLTFGLHTRIDDRVQHVIDRVRVGNLYVNRNQIGAVVGSQPFGGEGLSGTGPKAGGPHYVERLRAPDTPLAGVLAGPLLPLPAVQRALDGLGRPEPGLAARALDLPGPTGESNRLRLVPRGAVLCLGPVEALTEQVQVALAAGNAVLAVAEGAPQRLRALGAEPRLRALDGQVRADELARLAGLAAVVCTAERAALRPLRQALAAREGPILPLITELSPARYVLERHVCVDTTAAGGNASLLASAEE